MYIRTYVQVKVLIFKIIIMCVYIRIYVIESANTYVKIKVYIRMVQLNLNFTYVCSHTFTTCKHSEFGV